MDFMKTSVPITQIDSSSLNYIKKCSLCESEKFITILSGVKDNVSHAVDYDGNIMQCQNCGHAFLSPVINSKHLHLAYKNYYTQSRENLFASTHAKQDRFSIFKNFYGYRYKGVLSIRGIMIQAISLIVPFSRFFLLRAVRFLHVPSLNAKPKLLDVGCGRGDFLMRAEYCGYDAIGIDFDPETVDIALSRGLNAHISEIHELPELEIYDAITLSHVVEHVLNPVELLSHIYKRLKPGGYFYISTPNFNSSGRMFFNKDWRGYDVPRHMHFFDVEVLSSVLSKIGFTKVRQVYDLPQSIGVIRSSYKLKYPDGISFFELSRSFIQLLKGHFYSSKNLEVVVFKCYKSR